MLTYITWILWYFMNGFAAWIFITHIPNIKSQSLFCINIQLCCKIFRNFKQLTQSMLNKNSLFNKCSNAQEIKIYISPKGISTHIPSLKKCKCLLIWFWFNMIIIWFNMNMNLQIGNVSYHPHFPYCTRLCMMLWCVTLL